MTQSVAIISTGRTGTNFFAKLIGEEYPEASAYHERGFSRPIQILTNAYYSGLFPKSGLRWFWNVFKKPEIEQCEKPFHIDSNSFLYGIFAIIPDLQPGLKVIHIVRDPRTYVTSHLNFARFKTSSFIGNYLTPFWQPSPFLTGAMPARKYFSLSRMERYAWIWNFKNRVMQSLENSNTPYLRMRFEDVFYAPDPEAAFAQIADFIGLPPKAGIHKRFADSVNAAPKDRFAEWVEWTPSQAQALQKHCGALMELYGYGREPEWLAKIGAA